MKKLAVILAGGRSLRFGSNKARARWQGLTLLERVSLSLNEAGFQVLVADRHSDLYPWQGPLQALFSIGHCYHPEKILLTACDMPLLRPELLTLLWEKSLGLDVTVLRTETRLYPLPGVYSRRAMEEAGRLFQKGRRDLKSLMQTALTLREIKWEDGRSLTNINTQQDLREASL
ncbi:MAG: molybdenum cofactor guanylyltransferase [Deltaproteobacteria bacterium]|nr:molybdenum cofactor guanylyltransferase [Deltaproteobacteria bacterium]